jgi:FKBP-type peptidyl-prolyl cis-trans isomerase
MAEVQPKWDATRVFIVFIVVVFAVSSLALSILAIIQLTKDDETTDTNTTKIEPKEGKLQGTKLADFTPVATVEKLEIIDTKEGTGEVVKPGDTVTAHYTGAVAADGTIFQSSKDFGQAATFPLANVIKGWQDGVPGMKVGGVRRLVIPADQAYGATPPQGSGIPANAPLVFDIELQKIGG